MQRTPENFLPPGVGASRFSNVQSWKMGTSSLLSASLRYNLPLANNQYLKIIYLHFYTFRNATICKHCLNIYLISQWQQLPKLIRTCWGCGTVGHYLPGVCKTLDSIRSVQKLTHAWTVQKERGLCLPPVMRAVCSMGLFILLFSPQKVVKQLEYTQNGENQFIVGAYVCAYFEGEFLCVLSRF